MMEVSDDAKAIAAAVATIVAVSAAGIAYELPFVVRSVASVAAGFVALGVVSYLLTGNPVSALEED